MARLSRFTVPGLPHRVTQRGNRQQALFAEPGDYALYRDLLAERRRANGVACWAYCLMPNHVHLILAPASSDALSGSAEFLRIIISATLWTRPTPMLLRPCFERMERLLAEPALRQAFGRLGGRTLVA